MAKSKQVKRTTRTKVALWLMIAPTVFIIGIFILYGIANWALTASGVIGSNALTVTINIILFLLGTAAVLAWLPGLITGIVLLSNKK